MTHLLISGQGFSSFFAIFDDISKCLPHTPLWKMAKIWQKLKKSLVQKLTDESSVKSITDEDDSHPLIGEFNIKLFYSNMMKPLEEAEQIWKEKRDNQLEVNPEDLQVLVNLFQGQCKKMKEKYGTYSINTPLSNLIVANFKEYFNVSKMHVISRVRTNTNTYLVSLHIQT